MWVHTTMFNFWSIPYPLGLIGCHYDILRIQDGEMILISTYGSWSFTYNLGIILHIGIVLILNMNPIWV